MNKILISLVILLTLSASAFSQIQLFEKYTPKSKTIEPDINIFGYGQKLDTAGKFKITYFALVEKAWAEGLIGLSYAPARWCEFGLMIGIESTPDLYRVSSSLWMGNDKISLSGCFEKGYGHGNWWYKSTLGYSPNTKISFGLMSWRYNGSGMFLKCSSVKRGLGIWINPAYDFEFDQNRLTVGLDIKI